MKKLVLAAVAASLSAGIANADLSDECIGYADINEALQCAYDEGHFAGGESQKEITGQTADFWEGLALDKNAEIAALEAQLDALQVDRDWLNDVAVDLQNRNRDLRNQVEVHSENAQKFLNAAEVVTEHRARAGQTFTNTPVKFMKYIMSHVVEIRENLRRAEDRIRELESKMRKGDSNPLNWNNW